MLDLQHLSQTEKLNFTIETAFEALLQEATELELIEDSNTSIMYLKTQELTQNFQRSCRAILESLGMKT